MAKIGFVFPGQGSQKQGMLADLAAENPIVLDTFTRASEVLGKDLWLICQSDPEGSLNQTEVTQPALLAASVAISRLWFDRGGPRPAVMSGHSLGEYSALVLAGVLAFEDAIEVVHKRGQFMQDAVAPGDGKMAAIVGLEDAKLIDICARAESIGTVSAANFNSPGQIVIAGESAAVDCAMQWCKEAGAKRALPLNVSVPSHCPLMKPAAEALAEVLAGIAFAAPDIPVVQNVSGTIQTKPEQIKENLVRQLHMPVLWADCVRAIQEAGVEKLVEVGPGRVLCGLVKRIVPELGCMSSEDPQDFDSLVMEVAG